MNEPTTEKTLWHEFGQVIAIFGATVLSVYVGYLLFIVPYERHKEILSKLEVINYEVSKHALTYSWEIKRKD
jgi:hypothetical protein